MAKITLAIAAALVLLGVVMFAITGAKTSLIPAYVGVPLGICGAIAMKAEYRKHAMHVAVVIALIGFLLPLGRLIPVLVQGRIPAATALASLVLMALLCGAHVVLSIRSFIEARRNRGNAIA